MTTLTTPHQLDLAPTPTIITSPTPPTHLAPAKTEATTTATPPVTRKPLNVDHILRTFQTGYSLEHGRAAYARMGYPPEEIEAAFTDVQRRLAAVEDARIRAKQDQLLAVIHDWADTADKRNLANPERISRVGTAIGRYLTAALLASANAELHRRKVGPITLQDVAFTGIVHWHSVCTHTGTYAATSPMARIAQAAESFGYRDHPFDARQVAMIMKLLTALGITWQVAPPKYTPGRKESTAGKWALSASKEWEEAFRM